jgi:hypothetical protein
MCKPRRKIVAGTVPVPSAQYHLPRFTGNELRHEGPCLLRTRRYNKCMSAEPSRNVLECASRKRHHRHVSLRQLLGMLSSASTVFSAMYWVPGFGGVLLLMLGWFIPAAAVLGGLILLQWPLMIFAVRWSHANRKRLRAERQALIVPKPPSYR